MSNHRFTGKLTLWSSAPTPPDAKPIPPIEFDAAFGINGTWTVAARGLTVEIPDISSTVGFVTVKVLVIATNDQDATGSWDAKTGELTLSIELRFTFTGKVLSTPFTLKSTLALELDNTTAWALPTDATATATGRPLNAADGTFALASLGEFKGEALNGESCLVLLEGKLTPPPPAA